jgi:hypothetical protein
MSDNNSTWKDQGKVVKYLKGNDLLSQSYKRRTAAQ